MGKRASKIWADVCLHERTAHNEWVDGEPPRKHTHTHNSEMFSSAIAIRNSFCFPRFVSSLFLCCRLFSILLFSLPHSIPFCCSQVCSVFFSEHMSYIVRRAVEPFIVLTFRLDSTLLSWIHFVCLVMILGMRSWSFADALMFNDHSVCLSTVSFVHKHRHYQRQAVTLPAYFTRLLLERSDFFFTCLSIPIVKKDVIRSHQSDIYRCLFHFASM